MHIIDTPEPPYYSVTTTAQFTDNMEAYVETATSLLEQAKKIEGFLGLESSLQRDGGIAISYWKTLDAIKAWKFSEAHLKAKVQAKDQWFSAYITRIAKVERAY